jgi:hypothetical protein
VCMCMCIHILVYSALPNTLKDNEDVVFTLK